MCNASDCHECDLSLSLAAYASQCGAHRNGHGKPAAVKVPGEARNGSCLSTGSPFIDALDAELGRLRRFVGAHSEELWGRLLAVIEVSLSKGCLEVLSTKGREDAL